MTDDPDDQPSSDNNSDRGGGGSGFPGGGGGLGALLPLLLGLFRGKGIILLLALAAGAYFLLGNGHCNLGQLADQAQTLFSKSGYSFNPAEFNKASVYEGLEDDNAKNPLPEAVSLLKYAPRRGDQGQQGSCVAWSSAYAAQTVLTAAATHQDPNSIVFSPSYLYNQIKLDGCQGSYIQYAMEAMKKNGGVPLSQYPYRDDDCQRDPSSQFSNGRQNTIHGFTRLTNGNTQSISVRAIKEHLAKDAPVVIGMMVGQSFMQDMIGKEVWTPGRMDASQVGMGGHAMCVIGYDDRKLVGTDASGRSVYGGFQIMNSWGPDWGKNGIAWVGYGDFRNYVKEAYGIDPLPKSANVSAIPLECTIGLVNNADKKYIQLRQAGSNAFETVTSIKVGTRFKMEVNNETECYIYIFGQDENGKSFVLFPYLKPGETVSKHSPYCGITGYRLFPKSQSLEADNIGNKDYIAIVASRTELPYNEINQAISASARPTYADKVNEALRSRLAASISFNNTGDGRIHFAVNGAQDRVAATIVAFDKQP